MESKKPDKEAPPEFDADLHGDVETDSTGKNTLIRDPDASIDTSELEIIDYLPAENDKSKQAQQAEAPDPHDPYNSGVFDALNDETLESREWKSKRRN